MLVTETAISNIYTTLGGALRDIKHEGGVNNGRERVDNARAEGECIITRSRPLLTTPECFISRNAPPSVV